jgi:ATP-binding cassette subfamily C protein
VSFRGVSFAYGGRADPVVRGLSLEVPAGGHWVVVGPSGVGKSTVAGLTAGLLRPTVGEVLLGGRPVAGWSAADLARQRTLIPQEAYVFSGTVADNLGYLCPGPTPPAAALLSAAESVGAGELVDRLGGPEGRVDPATLSAGERQLMALARALLAPAPVVLLDEATCHLDPAAERHAESAFARRPDTTLLVIAHRVSSALRADQVLVLDGTETVAGTHREVMARSALYRELVGGWSDPTGVPGDADGVQAVAGARLADDGGEVVPHRALGEQQPARDLGDRRAVGRE